MLHEEQFSRLSKLKELLDAGILNEDEFAKEKEKVLKGNSESVNNQGFETQRQEESPTSSKIDNIVPKDNSLLFVQILLLVATITMFVLFVTSYDPVVFGIIGFITAIGTIVLSWIKKVGLPKAYSIVSTVVAGLLGFIMLITP